MKSLRMSALGTYEICPYLCKEQYAEVGVDSPEILSKDEETGIYAEFGIMLHEIFEHWGKNKIDGVLVPEKELIKMYETKLVDIKCQYPEGKKQDFIASGYEQISWFYDHYSLSTPLMVEHKFDGLYLVDGIDLPFNGTFDRLDGSFEHGRLILRDYKTGRSSKFTKKELESNMQAALYSLACERMFGIRPVEFEFIFTKDKKTKSVNITDMFLDKAKARIRINYERMLRGNWFPEANKGVFFCKNFCNSETCAKRKRKTPKYEGWEEFSKKR